MDRLGGIKYWGAATSSHQVEGKNHNQWTEWELSHAAESAAGAEHKYAHWLPAWEQVKAEATRPENYVSGIAVDFWERFNEDFDLVKALNLNAFELSIEWSRVEPEPGRWDEAAIGHYKEMIHALKSRGIEPFVKFWHWTNPTWFEEKGGFAKRANLPLFLRFVDKITRELHDDANYFLTINEPNVYMGMSYQQGVWPPGHKSVFEAFRVYRNLLKAHKRSYQIIKGIKPELKVGWSQHLTHFYGQNWLGKLTARIQAYPWNWWFMHRARQHMDYIGVNYYQSNRLHGFKTNNENVRQNDLGWEMRPADIEFVLTEVHRRFGKPIIITENGVADQADQYRQWWLEQTLAGISRAMEQGADIQGYFHWSLLDNFEWADGFWPRFGLVEVDRSTLKRTIRPSAKWLAQTIQTVQSRSAGHSGNEKL